MVVAESAHKWLVLIDVLIHIPLDKDKFSFSVLFPAEIIEMPLMDGYVKGNIYKNTRTKSEGKLDGTMHTILKILQQNMID